MPLQVDQRQDMSEARDEPIVAENNIVREIGEELAGEALSGVVETSVEAQCAMYRDVAEVVANRLSEKPPTAAANEARIGAGNNTPTVENLDGLDGAGLDGAADLPGGDLLSAGADISAGEDVSAALGGGGGADIVAADCSGVDCDCGGCFCVIS